MNEKAFPQGIIPADDPDAGKPFESGMDMRDYFASQAVAGLAQVNTLPNDTLGGMTSAERFASRAYEIADAMMVARGE